MLSNAGFGYSGRHLTGSKTSPSNRPTDFAPSQYFVLIHGRTYRPNDASGFQAGAPRRLRAFPVLPLDPRPDVQAERRERLQRRRPLEDVFVAGAQRLRFGAAASH